MKGGEEIRKGGIREREERKLMQIRQGGKSKDQELKCEDGEKHKAQMKKDMRKRTGNLKEQMERNEHTGGREEEEG